MTAMTGTTMIARRTTRRTRRAGARLLQITTTRSVGDAEGGVDGNGLVTYRVHRAPRMGSLSSRLPRHRDRLSLPASPLDQMRALCYCRHRSSSAPRVGLRLGASCTSAPRLPSRFPACPRPGRLLCSVKLADIARKLYRSSLPGTTLWTVPRLSQTGRPSVAGRRAAADAARPEAGPFSSPVLPEPTSDCAGL